MLAEQIVRRLESMRTVRQPLEATWRECFDFTFPERGSGLSGTSMTADDIKAKRVRVLDDTAVDASRMLSASLVSGTTPANSIWFGMDAGLDTSVYSQDSDEARWLDDAARVIFENIHQANFDAAAYECCIDLVPAGWFVMYIDEREGGGFAFEQWPVAQCFVAASRPGDPVDSIFREVELTVEQVVTEYGIDRVSWRTAEKWRNEKFDDKVKVCHAIFPRALRTVGSKAARNLPFASCHVEVAEKHLLRESGYHEFPCAVPRWMLVPGTPYATGPVANALGSIRTVNDIKALELANMDLAVSGMWIAEPDAGDFFGTEHRRHHRRRSIHPERLPGRRRAHQQWCRNRFIHHQRRLAPAFRWHGNRCRCDHQPPSDHQRHDCAGALRQRNQDRCRRRLRADGRLRGLPDRQGRGAGCEPGDPLRGRLHRGVK